MKKPDTYYVYFQDERLFQKDPDADPAAYWRGEEPTDHSLPDTLVGAVALAKYLEITGIASKDLTRIYRRTEIVREGGLWDWREEPVDEEPVD
jgi:hypothetical protein